MGFYKAVAEATSSPSPHVPTRAGDGPHALVYFL